MPCQTVESCRQSISKLAGQTVLLPNAADLHFVSGHTPAPGVDLGGQDGDITYHDTATGWTVNYVVWSAAQEAAAAGGLSPSKCYKLSALTTPGGRSVCYQDQAIRWNQLYVKFSHDGLVYVMNATDPRPPSLSVAAEDQRWAVTLVDSYQ